MSINYLSLIPWSEFEFESTRSRGAGGQHVNRTNSAVWLRWHPMTSSAFTEEQKLVLTKRLKLTVEGELIIRSESERSQEMNKKECLQKLQQILVQAFFVPKKRKATKPTYSSQRKRVEAKKHRQTIKSSRRKVDHD